MEHGNIIFPISSTVLASNTGQWQTAASTLGSFEPAFILGVISITDISSRLEGPIGHMQNVYGTLYPYRVLHNSLHFSFRENAIWLCYRRLGLTP